MTDSTPSSSPDAPLPGRRWRIVLRVLAFLLLLVASGVGYLAYDAWHFLNTPADTQNPKDVIVDIPSGVTFDRAAWILYKAGAITDVPRFRLLAQYHNKLGAIQAGEFQVNTGWTPDLVLQQIVSGKPLLYKLALREGLPWWEIAKLVEDGGFAKAAEFEAVIHDPAFLREYGIPFANAEGFLYPETYLLRKPKTLGGKEQAETVARILVETFWRRNWPIMAQYAAGDTQAQAGTPVFLPDFILKNDLPVRLKAATSVAARQVNGTRQSNGTDREKNAPLLAPVSAETLRRLVTLGSLVEKETGVAEERGKVAGVYANRLRLGMLLQCDPTIIYGLGKNQSGPIRKSQLADAKNLYNTYQHPGLPPGPICSPGAASMQAAGAPEQHKYLYFVATGQSNGTHTFSTNLNDHNQAVAKYRATQQ